MASTYRREIDGLRAIAVLSVIFFHAGFSQFSGGYVGVDVFFVISGYLIANIIKSDFERGEFSLVKFYEKRARRILPVLMLVIFCSLPFAWSWMAENQFRDFSGSILDVGLFVSNFYFWSNGGYFDISSEFRPFLHTWSLAVEEQFYIIFPILFIFLWGYFRSRVALWVAIIAITSFILCEIGWRYAPSANFYLMPSRSWELLAGSLCIFVSLRKKYYVHELFSILGLALIICSIYLLDENTPFPSFYSLTPVVGTALIILFCTDKTITYKILSSPVFVGIGLISYSAYLWHQPVFAFAKIKQLPDANENIMVVLVAFVLLLAYLSWRFVEKPFRVSKNKNVPYQRKLILFGLAFSTLLIVNIGIFQQKYPKIQNDFYLSLMPDDQKKMYAFLKKHQHQPERMVDNGRCVFWGDHISEEFLLRFDRCANIFKNKAVIIIGDSHAVDIYNSLAMSDFNTFLVGITKPGCRPHDTKPNCPYRDFLNFAKQKSAYIEKVIFHQSGSYLLADPDGKVDSIKAFYNSNSYKIAPSNIEVIKKYLNNLTNWVKVTWLGPFVEARIVFGPWLTLDQLRFNPVSIQAFQDLDNYLSNDILKKKYRFNFIPINPLLKPMMKTLVINDCLTVSDQDHFSNCGEKIVGELISSEMMTLILNNK